MLICIYVSYNSNFTNTSSLKDNVEYNGSFFSSIVCSSYSTFFLLAGN